MRFQTLSAAAAKLGQFVQQKPYPLNQSVKPLQSCSTSRTLLAILQLLASVTNLTAALSPLEALHLPHMYRPFPQPRLRTYLALARTRRKLLRFPFVSPTGHRRQLRPESRQQDYIGNPATLGSRHELDRSLIALRLHYRIVSPRKRVRPSAQPRLRTSPCACTHPSQTSRLPVCIANWSSETT